MAAGRTSPSDSTHGILNNYHSATKRLCYYLTNHRFIGFFPLFLKQIGLTALLQRQITERMKTPTELSVRPIPQLYRAILGVGPWHAMNRNTWSPLSRSRKS
jgi:hypothetical protein